MKLLKTTKELYLCTFSVTIPILTSEKELKYLIRKNDVQDAENLQNVFAASNGNLCSLRYIDDKPRVFVCWCDDDVITLVHELHHAVHFVSEELGVTCLESKAHMMQSLYGQAFEEFGLSIVREKKK